MRKTYKYRLYPTKEQEAKIQFTLERCRLLYNRLLDERRVAYNTDKTTLNYYNQANTLTERKKYIPALKQVHSQVLQDVVKRLDKAFQAFFRRVKTGEKPGYPRFKSVSRYNSFTYPQGGYSINGNRLVLSKIGEVKIKLHRQPQGKIKMCTVVVKNGKYYACLSCEVEPNILPESHKTVGIDLGVKHLAITSDGEFYEHPRFLRESERKLRKKQRSVSRKKKGSSRRRKAIRELAKVHEHIANQRRDYAHKVSRRLVNGYGLMAFENLNVQGMVKNHHLAKSIVDASWNQLVQYTTYKAEEAGRRVVLVDPKNTSQLCSNCGEIVPKKLSDRVHRCEHCGYVQDRDINAAQNILKRALVV
ncbi:RNA-guided endonuclease InsQ/TnpB family protein [Sulfobacillus thermosulfidooxidans]|uniref:RNA-guided endonuclease InsQ/TnpB family protein n=1 Tax=Sulfobacillus thermosulfidooxidans TaxID=28034 RepID=UPI0006B44286|nr:RNA-guided endonuclease TnpB family protein [Sulfobacillus thermosulfidooxidans]